MSPVDDANRAQRRASNPGGSAWVSANAGSGKTRVLTDRVARILLAGTPPQNILCLTFTKAAAAEMQTRLFKRLGGWAMADDETLRAELSGIGEQSYDGPALDRARTLFAKALETPGGLKIQTIHAFCGQVLRRFPLEAGVSPQFREIDAQASNILRSEILDEVARDAPTIFGDFARELSAETQLPKLMDAMLKRGDALLAFDAASLAAALGVDPTLHESDLRCACLETIGQDLLARISVAFHAHGTDKERATAAVLRAFEAKMPVDGWDRVQTFFLTKNLTPRSAHGFPTKNVKNAEAWIADAMEGIKAEIAATLDTIRGLRAYHRSCALAAFAKEFLTRYAAAKATRGVVDFDDLIEKTRALLETPGGADWVLYKLDGEIDHILVDEGQDTAPKQWAVVQALTRDMTSGQSTDRAARRTVFVVGDRKQSIYGFQGADPDAFEENRTHFSSALAAIDARMDVVDLAVSFRTAKPILDLVDDIFGGNDTAALGGASHHVALPDRPGRIDLWPLYTAEAEKTKPSWWEPVDTLADDNPRLRLARDLAEEIAGLIEARTPIPYRDAQHQIKWRPLRPGDVMVLVRSRNPFYSALIAALKEEGVPVAGADRLALTDALAVRDVLSLLRFLDTELDDLALAETLRSPLFGLSEDELFRLAHGRSGTLWERVRESGPPPVVATLRELRRRVDFLRPFELISEVLGRYDGRVRLAARLGPDCTDALDELLAQAMVYERAETPSLSGFLAWVLTGETEVVREMDGAADAVRVMTVHGAKGLEAPLVVLADVSDANRKDNQPILDIDGQTVWSAPQLERAARVEEANQAMVAREEAERDRLLYVGLTRAESWLMVVGTARPKSDKKQTSETPAKSWYDKVQQAFGMTPTDDAPETRLHAWTPDLEPSPVEPEVEGPAAIETGPLPAPLKPMPRYAPSDLPGSHALPGEVPDGGDPARALLRGDLTHKLLEMLPAQPPAQREATARLILGDDPDADEIAAEVTTLLETPELDWIFAEGSLAEVPFSVESTALGGRVEGRIDRVILSARGVDIVDFKSNRLIPKDQTDCPSAIRAQLTAYASAMAAAFPGHRITTHVLWTRDASLMEIKTGRDTGL